MKKLAILLAILGCSLSVQAQTLPVQIKTVGAFSYPAPSAVYTEVLKPTSAGNTLVVILFRNGNPTLSDSQNNVWTQVCSGVWITSTTGGPETLTITYGAVSYTALVAVEYPNGWVLDACAPLSSGTGISALSNGLNVSAGDLLIGYGWNTTSNYVNTTIGAPFQLEGFANIFLADTIQTTTGAASSSATWGMSVNWTQGLVALKLLAPPPAPVITPVTVNISATYEDGTVPTILSVGIADVTPNPATTVLTLTPDPVSGAASGLINLTSTETYDIILTVMGTQVGQQFYQANLVQSLMPAISKANFSVVLCKTTCTAGAIKSFTSSAQ